MSEPISIGDYVKFYPKIRGEPSEIGKIVDIDNFGVLTIEPKSFSVDSWVNTFGSYQRYQKDVIKMTESEVVIFLLEK